MMNVTQSWRKRLDEFDARNATCLKWTFKWIWQKLQDIDRVNWFGGSARRVKPRTNRPWLDWIKARYVEIRSALDRLDTKFIFRGKKYQALMCRVRSKAEKKLANYLTENGIKFEYEKKLKLGNIVLHPDFYLKDYGVYVEYWGLADSDKDYERISKLKLQLYYKHGVKVISVYPRHLRTLDHDFPQLFLEATGRKLPLKNTKRKEE